MRWRLAAVGRDRLLLAAIALVAAYLRLAHLDLAEFRREEAWNLLAAADLVAGRTVPLTGMGTSVAGLENGPMLLYLLALPLLVARDVALASAAIALTNLGALVVMAVLAARIFGRPAALFGATAYALGSWAVYYSRKIWPNDPMPLFSALLALGLYEAIVGGRRRGLLLAGGSLGVLVNLHPSGFALVPFAAAALLLRPALLRSRETAGGLAAAALLSAPFVLHEVRGGFPSVRALRGVAASGAGYDLLPFAFAADMVGPGAYATVVGGAIDTFASRALSATGLDVAMAALLALGVVGTAWRLVATTRRGAAAAAGAAEQPGGRYPGAPDGVVGDWRAPAVALLWLIVPLLFSTRRSVPLWNHYFIFLLPALFLFVGVGLAWLRRLTPVLPIALLAWAGIVQVQQFEALAMTLRTDGARTIYGVPLAFQRQAVDEAMARAGARPIVLVSQPGPGAPDGIDDLLPVWRFLLPEARGLRFDDGGGMVRLAPSETLYVVAPEADPIVDRLLAERGSAAGPEQPLPGSRRGYRYWVANAARPGEDLGRLVGGLRLERVDRTALAPAGGEMEVAAHWRVEARPLDQELAFFVQLVDDRGARLGGRDRAGVEAGRLEPGDELVAWGHFTSPPLAPGRYWLAVGAYRAVDTKRLDAIDTSGKPVGDVIRVGPLKAPLPPPDDRAAGTVLARFEDGIVLEGDHLPALTWRAEARPSRDYTVFVHLIGVDGKLAAQDDRQPRDGAYPTSIWEPGERILDQHALPGPLPPGRYREVVGLYDAATGLRLRRVDGGGDSIEIGILDVAR